MNRMSNGEKFNCIYLGWKWVFMVNSWPKLPPVWLFIQWGARPKKYVSLQKKIFTITWEIPISLKSWILIRSANSDHSTSDILYESNSWKTWVVGIKPVSYLYELISEISEADVNRNETLQLQRYRLHDMVVFRWLRRV